MAKEELKRFSLNPFIPILVTASIIVFGWWGALSYPLAWLVYLIISDKNAN